MNLVSTMQGRIERRLLVNLRADPNAIAASIPAPFRPLTLDGSAIVGICFIRLVELRPTGMPARLGLATENAAHRIAVAWEDEDGTHTGVWIPHRHTSSRLTATLGGVAFPAVHTHADIEAHTDPADGTLAITVADNAGTVASVVCRERTSVPPGSVFATTADAECFFRAGSVGFSPGRAAATCDGVDLTVERWDLEPYEIVTGTAPYFEHFVPDHADLAWDSAFLMRDVHCRWRGTTRLADTGNDRRLVSTCP